MNKSIRFGYHQFVHGYFVKLNVKLRKEDVPTLEKSFLGIGVIDNDTRGYRIEGVITHSEMSVFLRTLHLMKLDSKIEAMMNQKQELLDKAVTQKNIILDDTTIFPF
jgi:hypothetical protein